MKNVLISLPQLEWSVFLLSHIRHCILAKFNGKVKINVLSKNIMDEETFPYVCANDEIIDISRLEDEYDFIFNFDTDLIISSILNKRYGKINDLYNLIYIDKEANIWSNIASYFEISSDEPKLKINIINKCKSNKAESGVAIKNDYLRLYVKNSFFVDNSRLWHVPVRKSLIKRFDECNTVANLVTDDVFCALSGFAQGKKVIFLNLYKDYYNINYKENLYVQDIGDFLNGNKIAQIHRQI